MTCWRRPRLSLPPAWVIPSPAAAGPPLRRAPDVGTADPRPRWPACTASAREHGAGAVFAFPLIVGAIRAGVLGLYRRSPGSLRDGQLGDLLVLADMATMLLLDSLSDGAAAAADGHIDGAWLDGKSPDLAMHRAEIDQATGMLTVQLGVPVTEGFVRLRAYAYSEDRRLADVGE